MKTLITHFAVLLLLFVITGPVNAGQIDDEILAGLNSVYNLKFDEAESKFVLMQKAYPDNPKGFFYGSLLNFYRAIATRNEGYYTSFLEQSENVIEQCDKLLDKDPRNYDAMYYLGLSKSYRSLLMLTLNKSLLQAASDGNTGYRILKSLIESNPQYYDAYMGLGLYRVAIGFVPEKFQWLLTLIGFDGNIKEGVEYLLLSSQKGKFTRVDSKAFLCIFSMTEKEENDNESLRLSKELADEFPLSPFFKIFYSSMLLQYGFPAEAIENSDKALALNTDSFRNEISKSASAIIGSSYYRLNEFSKAIPHFEEFSKYVLPQDRCNVYFFMLGVCYEINGDRKNALNSYRKVRDDFINERDGELDKLSYRLAKQLTTNPLNEFDIKLIRASNMRESNEPAKALEIYDTILNSHMLDQHTSGDDLARYYFDSGLAYVYKKDYEKAVERFNKCVSVKPVNEVWLIPHAYFELGKIYSREGSMKKSEEMFERIYDYDDFDFESFLEMRVSSYRNK